MKSFTRVGTAVLLLPGAIGRTFTIRNACPFTIWPALFTDLNVAQNVPAFATGWEAGAFTQVNFTVPDNWKAGRIWVGIWSCTHHADWRISRLVVTATSRPIPALTPV